MPKYEYTYIHVCCHFHPSGGDDLTCFMVVCMWYQIINIKYAWCGLPAGSSTLSFLTSAIEVKHVCIGAYM